MFLASYYCYHPAVYDVNNVSNVHAFVGISAVAFDNDVAGIPDVASFPDVPGFPTVSGVPACCCRPLAYPAKNGCCWRPS
jgi:hypothetical protein